jgi:exonuclease III
METLKDNSVDIAGICETWLRDANSPVTAAIKSFGYSIQHNYRKEKKGGGTALIYKSCYSPSVFRTTTAYKSFEYTAATVKSNTATKVMFVIMYRPGQMCALFNQELDSFLSEVSTKADSLILAGDLNIHFNQLGNKLYKQALDVLQSYGLQRKIFEPTHIAGGSLDQIFTFSLNNQLECVTRIDSSGVLGSDHFPVFCDIKLTFQKKFFKEIKYRRLKEIDHDMFTDDLSCVIDKLQLTGSFGMAVEQLMAQTSDVLNLHAPLVTKRISVVAKAPWFDKEYRQLRTVRRKAEKAWRKSKSEAHLHVYKDLCTECSEMAQGKKKAHFSKMIDQAEGNPRTLYQLVNKELDRKQSKKLPDLGIDVADLATKFNTFFVDKIDKIREGMKDVAVPMLVESNHISKSKLMYDFQPTCLEEIKEIIKESGIKSSPADLLPQSLLKENIDLFLPTIVQLVNLSLSTGNVEGVKLADIIPLLKDDSLDPNVLKHFRPVSNLAFIGKLIERVVLRRLNDHLSQNNLHCSEQSAYKKNNSTETLLVKITNDLLIAIDERKATVVMLLDLSAAFDTVDHGLLLKILKCEIGLRGNVLKWFESFLTGRAQRIRLGDVTSEEILIKFGVPQGSVLGPVLFNIYIRSIYRCVKKLGFDIFGYADDHQIMKSFDSASQSIVLAYDIDKCFQEIKSWMNSYFLQLNDGKTQIIVFGSAKILNTIQLNGINMITSGTSIRFISNVKNLGIYMDSKLTMENQIVHLKKKSFSTLRNICKIRFLLSKDQLKVIVNSLVVSCLDYCNGLFYGITEKLLYQLQLVQNAAAKAITGKYKHDHLENDLKDLHWLDVRKRVIFKLGLLAYKSVNGLAPMYLQELFRYAHHGHVLKLTVPEFNTRYGQRSFSVIGPKLLNNLPIAVTSSVNVDVFKVALKTFLFNLSAAEMEILVN